MAYQQPSRLAIQALISRTQKSGTLSIEDRAIIQKMMDAPHGWDFHDRKWLGIGPNDSICAVASEMHDSFKRIIKNNDMKCTPPEGGWPQR